MTLAEIARESGLSASTLSRALTGNGYLSPEMRSRALAALERAGYSGRGAQKALRSPMKDVILVISGATGNTYEEVIQSLTRVADANRLRVLTAHTGYDNNMEQRMLRFAERSGCWGVVMTSVAELRPTISFIREMKTPIVTVARYLSPMLTDTVTQDSYDMGAQAALKFLACGHRRAAYLGGQRESSITQDKLQGFRDTLEAKGVPLPEEAVAYGALDCESGRAYGRAFLTEPNPPTAVFISNDIMAIGFLSVVQAAGLRVPQDVSVLCCDKTLASDIYTPRLSRFYIDWGETAGTLFHLLSRRREEPGRPRRLLTFDTKYEEGETLGRHAARA